MLFCSALQKVKHWSNMLHLKIFVFNSKFKFDDILNVTSYIILVKDSILHLFQSKNCLFSYWKWKIHFFMVSRDGKHVFQD